MISTALLALALAFSVQTAPTDPEMVRFERLRPVPSPTALAAIPAETQDRIDACDGELIFDPAAPADDAWSCDPHPPLVIDQPATVSLDAAATRVPATPGSTLPPPCEGTDQQVLVVQNWDDPLRCTPDGSQILVYVVPHGEHADPAVCEYMGALWMWDQQTKTAYCVGVDY